MFKLCHILKGLLANFLKIISNEDLWKLTESGDINLEIRRRKFWWIGHTLRKDRSEICASALIYNPQGKRTSKVDMVENHFKGEWEIIWWNETSGK
jgi:hypothetical protein